jgi:Domain of unknown function (DUF4349)/Putative zinc-finger
MPVRTHPFPEQDLMAYADGELRVEQAAKVAAHLEDCPECQTLLAELQSVSQRLQDWQVERVASGVSETVLKQLDLADALAIGKKDNRTTKFLDRIWARPLATLAATAVAMVALIVGFIYINQEHKMSRTAYDISSAPNTQRDLSPAFSAEAFMSSREAHSGVIGGVVGGSAPAPPSPSSSAGGPAQLVRSGPLIVRTAELVILAQSSQQARSDIERLVAARHGYIAQLEFTVQEDRSRSLNGSLRIPAAQLDPFLVELKRLGHVRSETQRGEDVTQKYVDTEARLSNLRTTEQRLNDLLRQRTGNLADVLAVEEQVDRVRGEIDRTVAEKNVLSYQTAYADVQVKVWEEYREPLGGGQGSALTSIRNAAVQGYRTLVDSALEVLLFLLSFGPVLTMMAAVLFFPARLLWRKRQQVQNSR